jgi:co-chaperonin GroES (HSP10)
MESGVSRVADKRLKEADWQEDRILVLPDDSDENFTVGGRRTIIAKPDVVKDKDKPTRGTVIAVGPGKIDPDRGVMVDQKYLPGQRIGFGTYAGIAFEEDGVQYRMMRPADVHLIF